MRRIYITFGGHAYDETTERIVSKAPGFGADEVRVYDDRWLMEHPFYEQNKWLFAHPDALNPSAPTPRGFGWFAWKPLILLDALERTQSGDVVLFTDADTYPIADLSVLYAECGKIGGIMLFSAVGCLHQNWCKRDTFIVMGQDEDKWRFRQHAVARFMLFEAGVWKAQQFLMEWLTYCLNPLANTMDPSRIYNFVDREYPDLREPRCEQAILTNLAHKYGLKLYREACQFGESVNNDRDLYPQLFVQEGTSKPKTLEGSRFRNV